MLIISPSVRDMVFPISSMSFRYVKTALPFGVVLFLCHNDRSIEEYKALDGMEKRVGKLYGIGLKGG